jgi:hypothetical protein
MYERFFNWEFATCGFLLKNTDWTQAFMLEFAEYKFHLPNSFHAEDNGVIHIHLLKTLLPDAKNAIQ